MLCNVASLSILDLRPWYCKLNPEEVCPCQFWACINVNIVRMHRVTHYHIKLCLTIDLVLWPWKWKTYLCQLSVINTSIFKMDIATLYYITLCNKVTWSILIYLNIYIWHNTYVNIQFKYKQWSQGSQACGLFWFLEAFIIAHVFLDICLDIFGAWVNQKNISFIH